MKLTQRNNKTDLTFAVIVSAAGPGRLYGYCELRYKKGMAFKLYNTGIQCRVLSYI